MGVSVVSGGLTVTLDERLWSLNPQTMAPWSATSHVGSDTLDPITVWRTQPSVRTVVGFLARNIAQVSLHGFTREADGDRERIDDDEPLAQVLKTPSSTTTAYEAMFGVVVDVCMWERHASWITEVDGVPSLERLPPQTWKFNRDGLGRPTSIRTVNEDRVESDIPLSQLFWMDGYPIPDASPLCSLAGLLEEQDESSKYRRELWRNGARFGAWIERPADAPKWESGAKNRFRTSMANFTSGGTRAGSTPVMEDGMKYHELTNGMTPEAAQQLEARKFAIAETAAAFYVPPVFVGVTDNSNYANVTAYREILYSDTLGPWFQQLGQAYDARVLPNPIVGTPDGAFVEFNVGEKLRLAFDQQAKIYQTAAGGPFMTRAEVRKRQNLKYIEGTDELIVPLNVIEGGQASPTDADSTEGSTSGGSGGSGSSGADGSPKAQTRSLSVAEVIQKVYLGVGKVISADEARAIINDAGGSLDTGTTFTTPGGADDD